jgi:hypothetical protein
MFKVISFLLIVIISFSACNNEKNYEITSADNYEKGKENLEEIERKNPERFLVVTGGRKQNLVKQTVIRGRIRNTAKVVTYKDVRVSMSFYSKTGALLEEDEEVIYDTISPGAGVSFKSKFFAPKGTDSVSLKIKGAKT